MIAERPIIMRMRRNLLRLVSLLSAIFLLGASTASARAVDSALREAFEASQKAEGARLNDHGLLDQDNARFRLSEYFGKGRPLVVSFIYTGCSTVCPAITSEFKRAVDEARIRFGSSFNVLSISFDPEHDSPERLKSYGARFTDDFSSFRFATSDPESMEALARQFGFYFYKKTDGSFDHIDMATVVRPDGVIYKQVYGIRGKASGVTERLSELLGGVSASKAGLSLADRIRYFCYKYDPATGAFVLDYPVIASLAIQGAIISAIVYLVWGRRLLGSFRKGSWAD
jgi:protein SCO1/2